MGSAGKGKMGMHFPSPPGTLVEIGFRQGDINQPFILGAIHEDHNVVQKTNPQQHRFLTQGQHQICFDDTPGQQGIEISTQQGKQGFRLQTQAQTEPSKPGLHCWTQEGSMRLSAKSDFSQTTQASCQIRVRDYRVEIQETYDLQITGALTWDLGQDQNLQARWLAFEAGNRHSLETEANACFSAQTGFFDLEKNLQLKAKETLDIQAKGLSGQAKTIRIIQDSGAEIRIDGQGIRFKSPVGIEIFAKTFQSQGRVSQQSLSSQENRTEAQTDIENQSEDLSSFMDPVSPAKAALIGSGRACMKLGQGIRSLSYLILESMGKIPEGSALAYSNQIQEEAELYQRTANPRNTAGAWGEEITDFVPALLSGFTLTRVFGLGVNATLCAMTGSVTAMDIVTSLIAPRKDSPLHGIIFIYESLSDLIQGLLRKEKEFDTVGGKDNWDPLLSFYSPNGPKVLFKKDENGNWHYENAETGQKAIQIWNNDHLKKNHSFSFSLSAPVYSESNTETQIYDLIPNRQARWDDGKAGLGLRFYKSTEVSREHATSISSFGKQENSLTHSAGTGLNLATVRIENSTAQLSADFNLASVKSQLKVDDITNKTAPSRPNQDRRIDGKSGATIAEFIFYIKITNKNQMTCSASGNFGFGFYFNIGLSSSGNEKRIFLGASGKLPPRPKFTSDLSINCEFPKIQDALKNEIKEN